MPSDSESSSSLSSIGTTGKASSPPPVADTRQMSEKLETILFQLRQVTRERDELRKRLALSSPGSTFDDCRPSPKPNHDYERLKIQCMKAMSDLQSLQNQHTKTLKRCEEAAKEADFYHTLHSRLLSDQSQLKEDMDTLKRKNTQLVREHNHLQQSCEEMKRLHDEDQKEITDLHSMSETKDENSSSKTLSAAARRSFFRRKHKHKRSGSKDGKDLLALDTISTDSIPFLDDSASLAYQRVQKVDCTSPRPVLILGPLLDAVKDMLVKESPGKFCRCPLEVMKASQQAIERGVKDCLFIDYKRRSGHFDVTTVASIKEITEKDCHCLLDIAPHAIERLHSVHIYPIVIFIRYKNAKQIKEQKDPIFLRDKVTQKHSKEQFETAQKIEQEYSKYFTGIVQGGALSSICTQIMTTVDQEQNKVLWIPAGPL